MALTTFDTSRAVTRVGFLLLDNFTMIALASAVEPLRMANQLSGEELYSWHMVTESGMPVSASDGLTFAADFSIADAPDFDLLIVAGGVDITRSFTAKQVSWLQSQARRKITLGGICTGAYVLAHAGLLDDHDCSAHWECMTALQEHFPKVRCNNHLFTIDKNRMTSSGGNTPLDMLLQMVSVQHGTKLSSAVSDMFICDRIRGEFDQQRMPLRQLHNSSEIKPKLVDVIELMENNLEEPIELDELAEFVHVSRRQLERMFHKHLSCSPSRYYLKLRLNRARQLLKQSSLPIVEIATACGFTSTPHFSRCYRKHIGVSPRDERKGMWLSADISSIIPGALELSRSNLAARSSSALNHAQAEPSFGTVSLQ